MRKSLIVTALLGFALFFSIVVSHIPLDLFAQNVPTTGKAGNFRVKFRTYNYQKEYFTTFTDVDSTDLVGGLTTDAFDWSSICGSTSDAPNFRYAYTTTAANDTLKCLLYGYDPLTGNSNLLDTIGLTILSTTNGGTTTYGTFSLSSNGYSPYIYLEIKQKAATNDQADNGTFEISIYGAPKNPYDREWKNP